MTAEAAGLPMNPRTARLAAELEAWGRRTISLSELWTLFARADPASATQADRRANLAASIATLAAIGTVTPSKALDRSSDPALPTRLTLQPPAASPPAAALARTVPWRPELAWAAAARLTTGQVGVLQAVNTWLRDRGRDTDILPLRERSLELLGHEKRLDALVGTSLFGTGRLTLALLRTFRARPPLPVRRISDGPILLVVENADTFDTLHKTLPTLPNDVGQLAWGAGAAFEASVLGISELDGITDVAYFGDLDADGLRIPASAARTAAVEGLPVIRPAHGLYRLLLEHGTPQPGQPVLDQDPATALAAWLSTSPCLAANLLMTGGRIPQETVTSRLLGVAGSDWTADLSSPRFDGAVVTCFRSGQG